MNSSVLLQKLIDIERSIGVETQSTTRRKVLDAQEYLLGVHWSIEAGHRPQAEDDQQAGKFYLLRKLAKPQAW